MFNVGEKIIYGSNGVCRVEEVCDMEGKTMYKLKPLWSGFTIMVPVDSTKVFMRPIMTAEEANAFIDALPAVEANGIESRVPRELTGYYEGLLSSHEVRDLAALTKAAYRKKVDLESKHKKLGQVDQRYLKKGENLLFGELAAALGIEREEVLDYITSRLEK